VRISERFEFMLGMTLLVLLAIGCLIVLRPFFSAILWALILSFSTWPIYIWVLGRLNGRETLASALMTLGVALVLVAPLAFLAATLADHVAGVIEIVRVVLDEGLPSAPTWLRDVPFFGGDLFEEWQKLAGSEAEFRAAVDPYVAQARNWALRSGANIGQGVVELTLSVLICFFFYRDGRDAAVHLHSGVRRVAGDRAQHLLEVAGSTIKGVVYGIMGTAFAQGLLATIGFWMAGVPGALLLGFLTFVLSLVPMGPPLIWVPAALWLFYTGETGWAIFMALWGFFVISSIDNIIKPWLISRENRLPILLVFLGVIGGVLAFGFVGIFIGPTLLAVGFTLLQEWIATTTGKPIKLVRTPRVRRRREKQPPPSNEVVKEDGGADV
jgi:predicted PurR-regulated permease PerM